MGHWLIDNRAWLFDGAGASLYAAIVGWLVSRRRADATPGQHQKAGRRSTLIQASGDVHLVGMTGRAESQVARAALDFLADRRLLTQPIDRESIRGHASSQPARFGKR